jgi:hypothetical protein
LKALRYRLALGVMCMASLGGAAVADPPASARAAPQQDADVGATGAAMPDDEFIEFLGADDVGDAAWWEFLKKSAPRKDPSPEAPQDAKP